MKVNFSCLIVFAFLLISNCMDNYGQEQEKRIKRISRNADAIVLGKVINQKSEWDAEKSRIYTDVTIDVDECLKGGMSNSTVVVRHLGGEVDGIGEFYSYVPQFKKSEEVLVFMKKERNEKFAVCEGHEGKISLGVVEDDKNNEKRLLKDVKTLKRKIKTLLLE